MGCSSSTAGRLAMEGAGADMIVALLLEENVTRVLETIEIMMRVLPIFLLWCSALSLSYPARSSFNRAR